MVVIMQTKTKRRRTTLHQLVVIAFLTFGLSYLNLVSNNRRLLEFLAVMLTKNEDRYHVVVQHHQTSTTIANENSNDATTNVEGAVPVEEEDWMHRTNKEDENVATAAAAATSTTRGPRSTAPSSASFNSSSNATDISTLDFYSEKENGRDETIIIGGKDAKTNNGTFQNSEKWLKGPRFSNIVETRMSDDDFVASLIMDASPLMSDNGSEHLLEHSICPSGSIFLKWQESEAARGQMTSQDLLDLRLEEENNEDKVMMDGWKNMTTTSSSTPNVASLTMRLMYLVIHEHQHKPARAEAKARWLEKNQNKTTMVLSSTSTTLSSVPLQHANTKNQPNNKLGPFDFECDHDTKYIITGIPSRRGFGSNFRAYGAEPIMLGLIMNRVALHMNSLHLGPRILRTNFFYSKCPRKDMQCMFMPLSPCVVTHDDIANAVMLPKDELVKFRSTGILDEIYAKEKVLVVETSNVHVLPKGFHDVFVKKIEKLYNREKIKHTDEALNSSNNSTSGTKHYPWELNDELMEKVKQFILDPENKWYMWYPAIMYGMRPNEYLKGELDRILSNVIPKDFNPATSIGIPIRGTYYFAFLSLTEISEYLEKSITLHDHFFICKRWR